MSTPSQLIHSFALSFKEGVSLSQPTESRVILRASFVDVPLEQPSPGVLAALQILSSASATEEQLADLARQYDGDLGPPRILYYLQRLARLGLICYTVNWNGIKLATLVPLSPVYQLTMINPDENEAYLLSRFAYLRQEDGQFVLESPLGYAKVVLHDWKATALLHTLTRPHRLSELSAEFQDISQETISMFVSLLLSGQAVSAVSDEEQSEQKQILAQWDFHDLLFHTRSRLGRHTNAYGGTYRFLGRIEPLTAVKSPPSDEVVSLYQPDIEALKAEDVPFTQVLEERQSWRTYGNHPITVEQLGEFLYRTARIRSCPEARPGEYERSNRPYPNGGACYELELYVVVNTCQGLPAGLYYYGPKEHLLYKLSGQTREVEALLAGAYQAAAQEDQPQVLIILTARFQRVSWKYASIAYALILKHVGVLYQTMYLVATAMGLAPCALGGGNSDLFASAAGTNYCAETSVGEFLLGSMVGKG